MKIDTAGTYTLRYSATDQCGNVATKDRVLTVAAPRTVLYADGTFIINESPKDISKNEAEHGGSTNTYEPLSSTNTYTFSSASSRPWNGVVTQIKSIEIGSEIQPTSMAHWFEDTYAETIDLTNLDSSHVRDFTKAFSYMSKMKSMDLSSLDVSGASIFDEMFTHDTLLESVDISGWNTGNVTSMRYMFNECNNLKSLDLSGFDTKNVTSFEYMFNNCKNLETLSVDNFDTSHASEFNSMFQNCESIKTLDVSSFDTSGTIRGDAFTFFFSYCTNLTTIYASGNFVVPSSHGYGSGMFGRCYALVGGAGTTYNSYKTNGEYARIDNPPDAPGYFTAKTA